MNSSREGAEQRWPLSLRVSGGGRIGDMAGRGAGGELSVERRGPAEEQICLLPENARGKISAWISAV